MSTKNSWYPTFDCGLDDFSTRGRCGASTCVSERKNAFWADTRRFFGDRDRTSSRSCFDFGEQMPWATRTLLQGGCRVESWFREESLWLEFPAVKPSRSEIRFGSQSISEVKIKSEFGPFGKSVGANLGVGEGQERVPLVISQSSTWIRFCLRFCKISNRHLWFLSILRLLGLRIVSKDSFKGV